MAAPGPALQLAHRHLRAGQLREAEGVLREAVALDSTDVAAWNLLALVLQRMNRREDSLACMRRAVEQPGATAEFHSNLGTLLAESGQFSEAEASCRAALRLHPGYANAHYNLGNALLGLRRFDEAILAFQRAIALQPDLVQAYNNLGGVLRHQGRLTEAIACCQSVLRITPGDATIYVNLGSLLRDLELIDDAVAAYRKALALQADNVEAHRNLGGIMRIQRRFTEAAECFQAVLRLAPQDAPALMNLGAVLQAQGRLSEACAFYQRAMKLQPESAVSVCAAGAALQAQGKIAEAMECYRKATALDPGYAPAHSNLGYANCELGRQEEGIACYRRALQAQGDFYEAYNNLGNALLETGQCPEAMAAYDKALLYRPDYPDPHWNKSLLLLLQGDFAQGWLEYEWRWLRFRECRRHLRQPIWDGRALAGQTLLMHAEQGFGDTIQFARYAALAAQRGGRVVVECQPELKGLLQTLPGVDRVCAQGEPLPDFDVQIPFLSLPGAWGTTLATIPAAEAYLSAEPARSQIWRKRLAGLGPGLKVGLSWAGRATHRKDRTRSCPAEHLGILGQVPGVRWVSLQKWIPPGFVGIPGLELADWTAELRDFTDTAALAANLDLVLAVDTAVVHLAGALGKPVWTMLPFMPDWRWLLGRTDSPWYPTMRLFRQGRPGDWAGMMGEVVQALGKTAKA